MTFLIREKGLYSIQKVQQRPGPSAQCPAPQRLEELTEEEERKGRHRAAGVSPSHSSRDAALAAALGSGGWSAAVGWFSETTLLLWSRTCAAPVGLGVRQEGSGVTSEKLKHFVREKELELAKETEQLKMSDETGWAWSQRQSRDLICSLWPRRPVTWAWGRSARLRPLYLSLSVGGRMEEKNCSE